MVHRDDIVKVVRVSAQACGDDPSELDGHSVRRGGATALFNGGVEFPRIMRFGRWSSDAVHTYLWEQRELQKDLASRMVAPARFRARERHEVDGTEDGRVSDERRVRFSDRVQTRDTVGVDAEEGVKRDPPRLTRATPSRASGLPTMAAMVRVSRATAGWCDNSWTL